MANWELRDHQVVAHQPLLQIAMLCWICFGQRCADNRDRSATGVGCCGVGGGIYAFRQPTDDDSAVLGQNPGELRGALDAFRRGLAGADHGDPRLLTQPLDVAGHEELLRRIQLFLWVERTQDFFGRMRAPDVWLFRHARAILRQTRARYHRPGR